MSRVTHSIAIRFITLSLLAVFGPSAVFAQTRACVTNEAESTVSVIDTATNTVIATVEVELAPFAVRLLAGFSHEEGNIQHGGSRAVCASLWQARNERAAQDDYSA